MTFIYIKLNTNILLHQEMRLLKSFWSAEQSDKDSILKKSFKSLANNSSQFLTARTSPQPHPCGIFECISHRYLVCDLYKYYILYIILLFIIYLYEFVRLFSKFVWHWLYHYYEKTVGGAQHYLCHLYIAKTITGINVLPEELRKRH